MKRQPTEWEKILANDSTDVGFNIQNIQTTYTVLQQQKKIKKWTEDIDISPKKEKWPKAHEKMLSILIIREMQIKTKRR